MDMAAAMTPRSQHLPERRSSPRLGSADYGEAARLRLRPGREATLVNLSRGGACVEGASRLLPGTPVEMQVAISGWHWSGKGRVLRCHVSALVLENGVRYRAALQFDPPVDAVAQERLGAVLLDAAPAGYQVPKKRSVDGTAAGSSYPRLDSQQGSGPETLGHSQDDSG
jgi:hypothetical protein